MKTISLKCPACGAPLSSEENRRWIYCSYCGTKIMLDDIEYVKEAAKTDRLQQIAGTMERLIGTKAEREEALEKSREYSRRVLPKFAAFSLLVFVAWIVLVLVLIKYV